MLTKGPVKGFPCLAPSLSLGNVLFTVTQSWKTFFLKGALRAQTHRQPGSRPSRFPPQQRCQGCFAKKDKIAGSHVWANQTTLAGHLSTTRFVRAKTGWRPFLPFRSEWGAVGNMPRLPTRISGMDRAQALFSGRKPGDAGDRLRLPPDQAAELSLKQNTEEKALRTRWSPVAKCLMFPPKGFVACSATAHKCCQCF